MADLIVNQEKQTQDVPENDSDSQIADGGGVGRIGRQGMDGVIDSKNKTNDDEADFNDPGEPFLDFTGEYHKSRCWGLGAGGWGLRVADK